MLLSAVALTPPHKSSSSSLSLTRSAPHPPHAGGHEPDECRLQDRRGRLPPRRQQDDRGGARQAGGAVQPHGPPRHTRRCQGVSSVAVCQAQQTAPPMHPTLPVCPQPPHSS
eukprot:104469-Chlamydomonas_euryale.AAC.1